MREKQRERERHQENKSLRTF